MTKRDYETPILEILKMDMQVITEGSGEMTDGGTGGIGGETDW